MAWGVHAWVVFGLLLGVHGERDLTLEPGTSGEDVVEMVEHRIVASCIFPDDKLFFRRVAYVESYDGEDEKTYREGYDGGIYQVDEDMFIATQSSQASSILQTYIDGIESNFTFIKWSVVQWSELRMPLYSGLSARLYYHYSAGDRDIPWDVADQAEFWKQYYREGGLNQQFEDAVSELDEECHRQVMDMVFVLDGSGSIGKQAFEEVKDFVKGMVQDLDIGEDNIRVGVLQYSSSVTEEFHLNSYFDKKSMMTAIAGIKYKGGGTRTHLALETMREKYFTAANGARPLGEAVPHFSIILTDGYSSDKQRTIDEAKLAHDANINMISISVGDNVDQDELWAIASQPKCIHQAKINDMEELESLKATINKVACQAPLIFSNGTMIGIIPPTNCKIKVSEEGATVKIKTKTGSATFYTALTNFPSSAYYEEKWDISPGNDGVIYLDPPAGKMSLMDGDQHVIFCNIEGDEKNETEVEVEIKPGIEEYNCEDRNPCSRANIIQERKLYFAHELSTKFVQCDLHGGCFEMDCAPGTVWDKEVGICDHPPKGRNRM